MHLNIISNLVDSYNLQYPPSIAQHIPRGWQRLGDRNLKNNQRSDS